jgi:DNA-binding NarL/FixJ family response regulator
MMPGRAILGVSARRNKERKEESESMLQPTFRVLFMGEHLSWSRVLQALEQAPESGIRLHRAHLTQEALQCIDGEQPDVILVAVGSASSAALELIRAARAKRQRTPVLALVTDNDERIRLAALEAGATECLPLAGIDGERLTRTIRAACLGSEALDVSKFCAKGADGMGSGLQSPQATDLSTVAAQGWVEVCHVLNNLLCVISGSADILAERLGQSEAAARHVTHIQDASRGATALLRRALAQISEKRAGEASDQRDPCH